MNRQLATGIAFASEKHKNQFDKGGRPYILHPIAVAQFLETEDNELMTIGILHDVVEDCGVTYAQLTAEGFSLRVVEGVRGMTKIPGETIGENIARMQLNPDVIRVKLCDLRHNMDLRRLRPEPKEKDFDRMRKYIYMYDVLYRSR